MSSSITDSGLNPAQMEAATTIEGPVLVIAGAGTGKTRTLVYRLAYMVEQGVAPGQILLLTFTRRAAQEMTGRAALLMDQSCQGVMGGTFHSVANILLRRYGHYKGYAPNFTILDRGEAEGVINLLKSSLELGGRGKKFPTKRVVLNMLSGAVNKALDLETLVLEQYEHLQEFLPDILQIKKHYDKFKMEHNLMDYDDLLINFRDILTDNVEVRQEVSDRFRYVMVDEYQDTNHIQAEIVRLIAKDHNNIMVVGDDSQSIYSFRGADFRNIMDFSRHFPGTRIIRLEENYRSSQFILEATNPIIAASREGYRKTLFSSIRGGSPPFLYRADDEQKEAGFISGRIRELRQEGKSLGEIAVLFRSGFHSYKLELELNKHGIDFEKRGGLKLTESAHIKDILAYFRVMVNQEDQLSWNRILLQLPKVGPKTAVRISDLLKTADDPLQVLENYKAGKAWQEYLTDLVAMLGRLAGKEPAAQFDIALDYYNPLLEQIYPDDYPRRRQDLEHLRGIISDYSEMQSFLDYVTLDPPESGLNPGGQTGPDTVVLSTIHSAKGLEWDTVFIIGLAENRFPSPYAATDPHQFEEERRLLYVAATRAKSALYLTYPRLTKGRDQVFQSASLTPFLAELPGGLLQPYHNVSSPASRKQSAPNTVQSRGEAGEAVQSTAEKETRKGDRVRHPFFGEGEVTFVYNPSKVTVHFHRHGSKTLRLDYTRLDILN
ncbi:MAG: ATP-dependent helicase [Desulfurivibrionaceae bacterium]